MNISRQTPTNNGIITLSNMSVEEYEAFKGLMGWACDYLYITHPITREKQLEIARKILAML